MSLLTAQPHCGRWLGSFLAGTSMPNRRRSRSSSTTTGLEGAVASEMGRVIVNRDPLRPSLSTSIEPPCARMIAALDQTVLLISHDRVFEPYSFREVWL